MAKNAALALLREAHSKGWRTVVVSEGDKLYEGTSAALAWDAVKSVTDAWVTFRDHHGAYLGRAYLMVPGPMTCEPDETIVDYTCDNAVGALCDRLTGESV